MPYIRKKNDTWYYQIKAIDERGKEVRHEYYGGRTRQECERSARLAMQYYDATGRYFEPLNAPFSYCLDVWIEKEVEVNLKPNSVDKYRNVVEKHLKPALGDLPLKKLTTAVLQDWINNQKAFYAKGTLNIFRSVLCAAMRWFISNRHWLVYDPMADVKTPRYDEQPKRPGVFTSEELDAIFEHFHEGTKLYMPCMIAYATGLRVGEALALTWDKIGMDTMSLKVTTTLYDKNGIPMIQNTPKTMGSIRMVYFGHKLQQAFRFQQIWQKENRRKVHPYFKSDFVCTKENGKPLTSNDIRWFNLWCKRQFGHGSFHSFRHTHATMLLESGDFALDYVSKRLGHSSIRTTADIYETITPKREREEVKKMEKLL